MLDEYFNRSIIDHYSVCWNKTTVLLSIERRKYASVVDHTTIKQKQIVSSDFKVELNDENL